MEYNIGDILFMTGTTDKYKIIDIEHLQGGGLYYSLENMRNGNTCLPFLEDELSILFDTLKEQRKEKLLNLK